MGEELDSESIHISFRKFLKICLYVGGNSSRKGIKSIIQEGERWRLAGAAGMNRGERTQDTSGEAGLRENTGSRRQGGRGGGSQMLVDKCDEIVKISCFRPQSS